MTAPACRTVDVDTLTYDSAVTVIYDQVKYDQVVYFLTEVPAERTFFVLACQDRVN